MNNLSQIITKEWLLSILESIQDAVIIIDSSGHVIFANHALTNIFGFSVDELIGNDLSVIMPQKYRDMHAQSMKKAADSHTDHHHKVIGKTVEMEGLHKDGHTFPIELSLTEKQVDDKFYFIGIVKDITDRKTAKKNIQEKISELEKMNKAMIGRELKMIDLKNQLSGKNL